MFHFIIPLKKRRLIGTVINRTLPRLFPVVVGILKNQQIKKQTQNSSDKQKVTIDADAREKNKLTGPFVFLSIYKLICPFLEFSIILS